MIALAEKSRRKKKGKPPAPTFEELLPSITKQASVAFRDSPPCEREEQVAETIANCFVAYVRLIERGLGHVTPFSRSPSSPSAYLAICPVWGTGAGRYVAVPICDPHALFVRRLQKVLPASTSAGSAPLVLSTAGATPMMSSRVCIVPVPGPLLGSVKVLGAPAMPVSKRS